MRATYKVPGGKLVSADVEVDEGAIGSVRLAGDFFAEPDEAITRIEEALSGVPVDTPANDIAQIAATALLDSDMLMGLTREAIGIVVRRALGKAIDWDDLDLEVFRGPVVSPVINVALDETLVEDVASGKRKPFLRFWEWDSPQIVMGSFQSYENEINQEGIDRYGITVSRRISGGGAMFMEPGNCITYSLVVPTSLVDGLSFEQSYPFLDEWVMEALATVGVKAKYVPLNDIASENGKIAGAAQKRFANGYTLHHVTMAYDIDAVKMNEYEMLVDIHDEYRPTGFSRTYPNLMTQEGIRGNEEMPDATHNTILPFTRFLAGAADYTICYYNNRIKTTHAHQLAMAAVYYSPLQFMYWYDSPSAYTGEPEIEFFDKVKTVWDDTKTVGGDIGEYVTIARRSGEEWFLGTLGNNDARRIATPLSFLDPDTKYVANIYTDDEKTNTKTKVKVTRLIAGSNTILHFDLKPSGGCAVHFVPATKEDLKKYKAYKKNQTL
jgi:Lipoate-protein ligase A